MKFFILLSFLFPITISFSQSWLDEAEKPTANFYEIRKKFDEWHKQNPDSKGLKQFKRWEYFMEPRVYPTGKFPEPDVLYKEKQKFDEQFSSNKINPIIATASWASLDPGVTSNNRAGRIDVIRLDPTNPNIIYAGSPSGGLWKSTDGGQTWITTTDNLGTLGVSDIAIDPSNTNNIYIATGNKDWGTLHRSYSLGVLKSTDGGNTWNTTGLNWNASLTRNIDRLIIAPSNPNVLIAATRDGMYRTTNAGTNWTQVKTGIFRDAEFKPGNDNIVYAASTTQIFKSTNQGATWTALTSILPTAGVQRIALAVTAAAPNIVYAMYAQTSNSDLMGFYKSSDAGVNWTLQSGGYLLLGGIAWYAMALHASPVDSTLLAVGGVQGKMSTTSGATWLGAVSGTDFHCFEAYPNSRDTVFTGSDMGIRKVTDLSAYGITFENLNFGGIKTLLNYKMGVSQSNPSITFSGNQDLGTLKYDNSTGILASSLINGDGGYVEVDYLNPNYVYATYQYGKFYRSINGGNSYTSCSPPSMSGTGSFVTPFALHTQNPQTIYIGYDEIWKSTDGGTSWTQMSNFTGSSDLSHIAVSPSNGDVVYCATGFEIYKTTNGGTSWTTITGTLSASTELISSIGVHSTSPNTVWVTFSGYSAGDKVFKSTNGGTTWTNVTQNLPNVPMNCIIQEPGNANEAIYVGSDLGVFYKDNLLGTWVPFNTGLPNAIVADLEINAPTNKIYAATHGRGMWWSDTYSYATNVANTNEINSVNIFPNPTKGVFTIEFPSALKEKTKISVFDVAGKIIIEKETSDQISVIDLTSYPSGSYMVQIADSETCCDYKIVLEK